jgi:ubiquinone biosynthesis protein
MEKAHRTIENELGNSTGEIFAEFSAPIAAASIAQVHKAKVKDNDETRPVAVKVLRPHVEKRFYRDLADYYFAARLIERWHKPSRRLRPVAVVDTLAHSVAMEMDLRLEAAAISEMAENIANDRGFRVPQVDWQRTSQRVLTLEWIDGIPLGDMRRLQAAGHNLPKLGERLLQAFLLHAMRDGFFHADMHHGNLFIDKTGDIVAVDFGIMGRLGAMEKKFLAEILYGFVTRDYLRAARVHFEAGYVPEEYSVEEFAQALRAIGEPIQDRTADEVSMGQFLGQLLQYTEVFNMQTRPELLLLQKTMLVVEGVARTLNPQLNMWKTAEPVVRAWVEKEIGMEARLDEIRNNAAIMGRLLVDAPVILTRTEQMLRSTALSGMRLDDNTIARLATASSAKSFGNGTALWVIAVSLASMAFYLIAG